MPKEPIIKAIRQRRLTAKLSVRDFASIAGMSERTYQRVENGESDMKLSQLRSITRALNITELDLILDTLNTGKDISSEVQAAARLLSPKIQVMLTNLIIAVCM